MLLGFRFAHSIQYTNMASVKTRLLIVSDTHGLGFNSENRPFKSAVVALHCGDLTDGSKLEEFRTTIQLLKDLDAPLKLAIAGNHDFTMDIPAFERKVAEASPPLDPTLVAKEYGLPEEARQLFSQARDAGIVFLDEGTHHFKLKNGATLRIYASPFTPSQGQWGFQYPPDSGHKFSIDEGVDVVITHGPPKGILDISYGRERTGCQDLFAAVAQSRPRLHCFRHIHEGWGAKLVAWREKRQPKPSHFTAIDNSRARMIAKLASLEPSEHDDPQEAEQKVRRLKRYDRDRCCTTSHCSEDDHPLKPNEHTLFVNAALYDSGSFAQRPWLVEIDLPVDDSYKK